MTFKQLVLRADRGWTKHYSDNPLTNFLAADDETIRSEPADDQSDTLAGFILRELKEVHDPKASEKDQLGEAFVVVDRAVKELTSVASSLEDDVEEMAAEEGD
jgi:hypothetical protein